MWLVHFILTENDETTDDGSFLRFYMIFDEENMIYVYRPSFNNWKYQSPNSHHLAHVQKYATYADAERSARKLQNECNKEIAHISPEELDKELRNKRPPKFVVREANIEIAGQKGIKTEKVRKVSSKGQVIQITFAENARKLYIAKDVVNDDIFDYLPQNAYHITSSQPVRAKRWARGVPTNILNQVKKKLVGYAPAQYGWGKIASVEAVDVKDLMHTHGE